MPTQTIEAGADDVEEDVTNSTLSSTSNTIRLGTVGEMESGVNYSAGFRFQNTAIPTGATVTSAVLQMGNAGGGSLIPTAKAYIDNVDSGAAWGSSDRPEQITKFPVAGVAVDFDQDEVGDPGSVFTADMTSAVQEVLNRGGWAEFQSLRFLVSGADFPDNEYVEIDASEKSGGVPAVLVVSYTHPSNSVDLLWDIEAAVAKTTDLLWDVSQTVAKSPALQWNVYINIDAPKTVGLQWDVSKTVGTSAQLLWDAIQTQELSQGMAYIHGPTRPVLNPRDIEAALKGKELRMRVGDLVARVDSVEVIQLAAAKAKPGKLYAVGEETPTRQPAIPAKPDDDVILFTLALIDSEEI